MVRGTDGTVNLDFGGKAPGRGAYICPNPECLKKALRSKALDRSLEVTIPEAVYDRLAKEMARAACQLRRHGKSARHWATRW